ncbi:MAG: bactofilin family protein [Candidatus Binataceae bacterium]
MDLPGGYENLIHQMDPNAASAAPPRVPAQGWIEERTRIAVGRNANVSGRLVFTEPVRIEGHFRGEVSSADLIVIAETGIIEGKVRALRMLVLGQMQGEITECRRVVLGPRSWTLGKIQTERLTVCEGARLEADVRMLFRNQPER